uniref:hypothetical protein n=1 Tax=Enhygromyxa salina TaxID=215803 RepID=UPI001C636FC2
MADLDRYLRYLQRDDVTELVLQTGKVAALKLTSGKLHPLTKSPLGSAHIVTLLEGVNWGPLVPRHDTGGQSQAASSNGVDYRCRIARREGQLQVRVLSDESPPVQAQQAPAQQAPAPSPSPSPRVTPTPSPRVTSTPSPSPSPRVTPTPKP